MCSSDLDIAAPWQAPHSFTRHAGIRCHRASGIQSNAAQILNMFRNEERTGFQYKHAQIPAAFAIDLFRGIRSEHTCADYDGVKWEASVIDGFVLGAAKVSAQNIQREGGLLNFRCCGAVD